MDEKNNRLKNKQTTKINAQIAKKARITAVNEHGYSKSGTRINLHRNKDKDSE
jgi:hypothetical protein